MTKTLISFLGKSRLNSKTGYIPAKYDFHSVQKVTPYFGIALSEVIKPDKLILIGTSGSMWDIFFAQSEADDEHILALMEAAETSSVSEALLAPCLPRLQKKLGCEVQCLVINYAVKETEQMDLLLTLAASLTAREHISIDITHAFRHLPMLALVAARYLHTVKGIITDNIYYGALEMTAKGITPVIKLEGLLTMLEWTDALASYDKDGDYQPFAELYRAEGQTEAAATLSKAAFYEKTNQIGQARAPLKKFREIDIVTPINSLFIKELNRRTDWVDSERFAQRQLEMAQHYLSKNNYLSAAILMLEAFISHLLQLHRGDPQNYGDRDQAREVLRAKIKSTPKPQRTQLQNAYEDLRHIRNALAHGTKVKTAHLQSAFADSEKLHSTMQNSLEIIRQAIEKGQSV